MNPLFIEGSRILSALLIEASKHVPASQLARAGLTRAPLTGIAPILGSMVVGAGIAAFAIPASRRWILENSSKAARELKHRVQERVELVRENVVGPEPVVIETPD